LRRELPVNKYSIILVDDHVILREGIKRIIEEVTTLSVIGEANDGLDLLKLLRNSNPHLIILDISLPYMRGLETTREIKSTHPETKVLILTMHKRKEYVYHAFRAGAEGYLLKEDSDRELLVAIETIRRGGVYLSPYFSKLLTDDLLHACRGTGTSPAHVLTNREREVLKLIAEGRSSQEIADLLFISVRTVAHHRASLIRKLHLKKVADLVKYAIREGYTSETP
jgi:DNA-binding NarL/FixJ family response regulator